MIITFVCIVFGLFVILTVPIKSANILGLFPLPLKSHYIIYDSILSELAKRGHRITVFNTFPKTIPQPNFEDVEVKDYVSFDHNFALDNTYKYHNPIKQILLLTSTIELEKAMVSSESMRKLLASNRSYDLLITELFHSDVMLAFTTKFKAPFISFCGGPIYPWGANRIGNPSNPSYIPYPHTDTPFMTNDATNFFHRMCNTLLYLFADIMYRYKSYTVGDDIARQFLNSTIPPLSEIAKKTSLILMFSHFSINTPMPLLPNVIEIAGVQIKELVPLSQDIEKFINESEHGVIYFSMGSLLKSETMPEEKRNAFLYAFSKIPQRILWKWGNDTLPGKTDNILISKWFPQRDILAHPNVKLFLSHGGALGVNEAVYEGVPILGIPMYADQTLNLRSLEWQGAAEALEYTDISKETVLSKIKLMLNDNKYSENMKRLSAIYRDRPMSPMDTAIYWIEYVIRHKGAPHLRSAAVDLPLYQYLLLDVIAFCLLILIMLILVVYYCFKMFVKFACRSKPKINSKKKN